MNEDARATADRLDALVADLIGRRCFAAIGGRDVEFAFILHIGEQEKRSLRLSNPRLSFLERTFEGSHTLLVECTWRIDGPEGVCASCLDAAKPVGPRDDALAELVDRAIERVSVEAPGFDLALAFEGGYTLRVFASEVDEKAKRSNWIYAYPGGRAICGPRSRVWIEAPPPPPPVEGDEDVVSEWKGRWRDREE